MSEKKPSGSVKTLLRILKDTKVIRGYLLSCALISLVSVSMALLGPELLGKLTDVIYDYWAEHTAVDMGRFVKDCLVLAGVYAAAAASELVTMYLMNHVVSNHFTCGLRIKISDKIRRLPVKFVDDTPNGEVISRMMHDVSMMGNSVHNIFNLTISGMIKLVGITVIVFCLQPVMAAAVVLFVPLSLLLSAWIAGRSEAHFTQSRTINGKIYALTEEDYTGFDTVKAFHLEPRQRREHAALCDERRKMLENGYYLSGVVQPIVAFTNHLAYIIICVIGGYFAVTGRIRVGDVVAFILYAKLFAGPLESIANGLSMMQNTIASAKRVYDLLDQEEMQEAETESLPQVQGNVTFEHVNFSYSRDMPLIQDLNMQVKAGQKVAIVGPTGGGKTTIVNLLMRFYDVNSGRILLDGVDIHRIHRDALRREFSMVLQDTWLFSGSIYENIAYGKRGAEPEEVYEAARRAHIDHFIHTLPDGYDTIINEESTNISSGQKQLLTIARAYLANRRILILDEATSNVDTRTEILIQNTMDELMKGRTSFVIAHRLSTIVDADIILVVDQGRIVEQGSHQELLEKGGFYSEIYNSQYDLLQ